MLKKLLKYDLFYTYKIIIIYYALSLIFAILTRIFLNIDSSTIMNIIGKICSGITISMILNIIINALIRNWVRFQTNFYKDESYLTHTLPVTRTKLYLSKSITALITMFTSILIIVISLFIAYYSKENFNILKESLFGISTVFDISPTPFVISIVVLIFLEIFLILTIVYSGIILGNKKNNNKSLWTVIYSIILYFLTQGIILIIIALFALFDENVLNLFITNNIENIKTLKIIITLSISIYSIFVVAYTFINIKLFKKGVNVD